MVLRAVLYRVLRFWSSFKSSFQPDCVRFMQGFVGLVSGWRVALGVGGPDGFPCGWLLGNLVRFIGG